LIKVLSYITGSFSIKETVGNNSKQTAVMGGNVGWHARHNSVEDPSRNFD